MVIRKEITSCLFLLHLLSYLSWQMSKNISLCTAPSLWQRLHSYWMNSSTAPQATCHYIICIQVKAEEQWLTGRNCLNRKTRVSSFSVPIRQAATHIDLGTDEMLFCLHLCVSFDPQISSPHNCGHGTAPKVFKSTVVCFWWWDRKGEDTGNTLAKQKARP